MSGGRRARETSPGVQTNQRNTNEAVGVHSPLDVTGGHQRQPAHWFSLGSVSPQNGVLMASRPSLLVVISLKTDAGKRTSLHPPVAVVAMWISLPGLTLSCDC